MVRVRRETTTSKYEKWEKRNRYQKETKDVIHYTTMVQTKIRTKWRL